MKGPSFSKHKFQLNIQSQNYLRQTQLVTTLLYRPSSPKHGSWLRSRAVRRPVICRRRRFVKNRQMDPRLAIRNGEKPKMGKPANDLRRPNFSVLEIKDERPFLLIVEGRNMKWRGKYYYCLTCANGNPDITKETGNGRIEDGTFRLAREHKPTCLP